MTGLHVNSRAKTRPLALPLAGLLWLSAGGAALAQAPPITAPPVAAAPAPATAQAALDLPALIERALAHNPELAAAGFDAAAAAARTRGADAAGKPRITLEGGLTHYGDDQRLFGARFNGELGAFGADFLVAEFVLRVPLYTSGRLVAEMRAAELLQASGSQRLARSRSDLAYNVSSLFYAQLAQERLIAALAQAEDAVQAQLRRVQALVREGKAAAVDALRTEVRLADLRQRTLRERNSLVVLQGALLNLVGERAAGAPLALLGTLTAPAADTREPAALAARALQQRADVAAARTELQAQQARLDAARATYGPSLNLLAAAGSRAVFAPSQQPGNTARQDGTWRVGVTFEVPLFDGGRVSARVDEEAARLAAQRERLDRLALQVRLDIETAHANLASALERVASAESARGLARENLRIEQEKYTLGRGTAFDVLDAQSALTDIEAVHIRALADARTAAAQLAWALGKDLS
jgi:outer membrane protein TolC